MSASILELCDIIPTGSIPSMNMNNSILAAGLSDLMTPALHCHILLTMKWFKVIEYSPFELPYTLFFA